MNKKSILIVAPRYPYKDNMEFVFVKKLVDEWANTGHHCTVITIFSKTAYKRGHIEYKPEVYRDEVAPGIMIDVYNPRFISTGLIVAGISLNSWAATQAVEKQLKRLNIRFDFIYCHFFSSALMVFRYAVEHNIPLFVATGESEVKLLNKPYPHFSWSVFKAYLKGVIAVSTKNKEDATKLGMIDSLNCRVFPNGTDTSIFKPMDRLECRKKLGFSQDAFIVSCVGFFCERKGQNRLLEAVRLLDNNNIKLLFLGRAAKYNSFPLEGEEICYKGSVGNKDLPNYLCASDVFCLPTRAEGCCNAVIEALACGIPVVSSNLPFNWDVLDDSNSILVNPDSIDEIADAIVRLMDDKDLRKKLSDGAKKKSQNLSIEGRATGIMNYIKDRL